jgi:hypothetical protein
MPHHTTTPTIIPTLLTGYFHETIGDVHRYTYRKFQPGLWDNVAHDRKGGEKFGGTQQSSHMIFTASGSTIIPSPVKGRRASMGQHVSRQYKSLDSGSGVDLFGSSAHIALNRRASHADTFSDFRKWVPEFVESSDTQDGGEFDGYNSHSNFNGNGNGGIGNKVPFLRPEDAVERDDDESQRSGPYETGLYASSNSDSVTAADVFRDDDSLSRGSRGGTGTSTPLDPPPAQPTHSSQPTGHDFASLASRFFASAVETEERNTLDPTVEDAMETANRFLLQGMTDESNGEGNGAGGGGGGGGGASGRTKSQSAFQSFFEVSPSEDKEDEGEREDGTGNRSGDPLQLLKTALKRSHSDPQMPSQQSIAQSQYSDDNQNHQIQIQGDQNRLQSIITTKSRGNPELDLPENESNASNESNNGSNQLGGVGFAHEVTNGSTPMHSRSSGSGAGADASPAASVLGGSGNALSEEEKLEEYLTWLDRQHEGVQGESK